MTVKAAGNIKNSASTNGTQGGAFAQRLLQILNDGSLALMISIGHQLGLFNTLAQGSPLTVRQFAQKA